MPDYSAQPLTYSAVLLYRPTAAVLEESTGGKVSMDLAFPIEELQEMLKTVFSDPVHTDITPTATGGVMATMPVRGTPVVKRASFDPLRLDVLTTSPGETGDAIARLHRFLAQHAPMLEPHAYGLNYELEFTHDEIMDASTWLAERFLQPGLNLGDDWSVEAQRIRFVLRQASGDHKTIDLQPRAGRGSYVFAYINNHFAALGNVSPETPSSWSEAIIREYEPAYAFLRKLIEKPVSPSAE